MVKVGIVGVGVVGESVAKILEDNQDIIKARSGEDVVVAKGVVKNLNKKRDVNIKLTNSIDELIEDESIDIIVELMGGVDDAFDVVKRSLNAKKAVVTANKALLAYHRYELEKIADDIPFEYEASVAGGIPIINALREGLSANHIESIMGIMNGTCNYILTKMGNEGADFSETLKEAKELGYAEADPTFDVGGFDAAHKLLILGSIAYGIDAKPEDILIEGIESIDPMDMEFAKEFGYVIKLLAIAKRVANEVELRVHPTFISSDRMIAKVDGVMNGISVIGDKVGETMYYGAGAGGDATASAVVSDIIDIVQGDKPPMLGFKRPLEGKKLALAKREDIVSQYYIRTKVEDRVGVLAKIAGVFGENGISIKITQQKFTDSAGETNLLFLTHMAREVNIQKAIKDIEKLDFIKGSTIMVRVEEE